MSQEGLHPVQVRTGAEPLSLAVLAARSLGIAGFTAVVASVFLPWFSVPGISQSLEIIARSCLANEIFRALCLAVVILSAVSYFYFRDWRRKCGLIFLVLLIALLFYPYCVTVWCPSVAGEASWIQTQHESLTTATGDIYTSQEDKDAFWRQRIYVVNRPMDTEVFYLPDWGPHNFAWGRTIELVEWFGVSTWFAAFIRKGWVLAIAGTCLVILALCRENDEAVQTSTLQLARRGLVLFLAALATALLPTLVAGVQLTKAKKAAQRGDHLEALNALRTSARWMPSVREAGDYVLQTGLLESALGWDSPEARFYRAKLLEEQGFAFEARDSYLEGISHSEDNPALAREYGKALISQAANAINSGELNPAVYLLGKVLAVDPCNLKANYALQLASLRRGDVESVARLRQRMIDTYRYYNSPTKNAVLANAEENLAFGENGRGNFTAAMAAWRAAKRR